MSCQDTKWRTLVRIDCVLDDRIWVILPGRNPYKVFSIPLNQVPDFVLDKAVPGYRLHAQVNIGAEDDRDIVFSDWEIK